MRILFVVNTLPPADLSGVGEQVLQLAAGLRHLGHDIEILGRAGGAKLWFPVRVLPGLFRALRAFRPDVVQVHESDGALAALLVAAMAPALEPRPRLTALFQVSYVEERRAVRPLWSGGELLAAPTAAERRFRWLKAPLQIALGRLTAALADAVIAPSRATAAEVARDYRIGRRGRAGGVAVVPNATGGLEAAPPASSSPLPAPPGGYLLFVGRLRLRKGLEVLLAALERLRERGHELPLLVAGDGERRHPLKSQAARRGLGEGVLFLGRQGRGEVRALLGGARALVVPSLYEGMPLVVLEAMAAGVPVVASRVSGIPEVVLDGETGWLVPPGDPSSLAAALARVWEDREEARRRGQAGRRRLEESYRPEDAARSWLAAVGRRGEEEATR
jgi:glycosyltransferase involved in cell wall biosynthesis